MSQWKPKSRKTRSNRPRAAACRRAPLEVAWDKSGAQGGVEVIVLDEPQGWMRPDELDRYRGPYKGAQISICPTKGEVWVKVLVGRHRHQDPRALQERLRMLEQVAVRNGGLVALDEGPLWKQVEFLENVLEFRMRPPCGCPPCRAAAAA